jgi:thiamine biosynthesis lipoprotein
VAAETLHRKLCPAAYNHCDNWLDRPQPVWGIRSTRWHKVGRDVLTLHTFFFAAMGTNCSLHLYADHAVEAERIAQLVAAEIERIESRYSRYRPTSDLAQMNRVAEVAGSIEVDDETAGLLDYAFMAYETSNGLFDITSGLLRKAWNFRLSQIPDQATLDALLPRVGLERVRWQAPRLSFTVAGMEVDLGGLAKEYAADRAAEQCELAGAQHALVDLGGDIRIVGPQPDGHPWPIGIRHPREPGMLMRTLEIARGALATSGDYERCIEIGGQRYGHILNPKTGWPVRGLCSVSVVADQCLVAGTLSTIAMLKGLDGIGWLNGLGVPHLWMDDQGHSGGSASRPD